MEILQLPVLTNNYIFILHDRQNPALAKPVIECLANLGAELIAIFHTHHHHDHIGGNRELIDRFPKINIYGGALDRGRIPHQQVFLNEGDRVQFDDRFAEVFFVPGHTHAHIAYYFSPTEKESVGELFCGDTLFAGGCGRLKEGTPAQMVDSLRKLRNLPDNTRVWCAHEYTLGNLQFALTVDPNNRDLQQRYNRVVQARQNRKATIPSNLGLEKLTNPFLRWDTAAIESKTNSRDAVECFARVRDMNQIITI
jgi:hydroxyacylglutathione hydrolase